ncbi:MAG: FtsX-like permease family protein, partial [Thermoplasmata archaeon]|nr:FtsX-like permease family protein [Thermoplasmata archaeon]
SALSDGGSELVRPILRLATRLTPRTRATAWAIAFACMVLVSALSLADGLANGIGSVADRIGSGPAVYIEGTDLLGSAIRPDSLANISSDFVAMRVHAAELEVNGMTIPAIVVALQAYHGGLGTTTFPVGRNDVSLDAGLRTRIVAESGAPVGSSGNLSLFGLRLTNLPIVGPPPSRSPLFPDDWVYVRADLLAAMNPVLGGSVQAILANASLDATTVNRLHLTRLETLGAVDFVRGSVAEVQDALRLVALLIAVVIGLLVYAAMGLEVHQRAREIATLRSLGASPAMVAGVYESQALLLALGGAILGSALGIVVTNAIVSFAPLFGLPNLVVLTPPIGAVLLALLLALVAAGVAGLVPSRRAAVLVRSPEAIPS